MPVRTLAVHELLSRVVRKFCMFGFPRTLPLFHSQKIWSGQEKRASNIWAVHCVNRAAGHRAVSDFAYRGQDSRGSSAVAESRRACQIGRARVCEVWNVLVVCGSRGCNSKLTGGSWKQVWETQEVSRRLMEGQHRRTCADIVSAQVFGQ